MPDSITDAERKAIDAAPVTKVKPGRARGVNSRTAPMTMLMTKGKASSAKLTRVPKSST